MAVTFRPCTQEGNYCPVCFNSQQESRYVCHIYNEEKHLHHMIHEKCAKIWTKTRLDDPKCIECQKSFKVKDILSEEEIETAKAESSETLKKKLFELIRIEIPQSIGYAVFFGIFEAFTLTSMVFNDSQVDTRITAGVVAAIAGGYIFNRVNPLFVCTIFNLSIMKQISMLSAAYTLFGISIHDLARNYLPGSYFHPFVLKAVQGVFFFAFSMMVKRVIIEGFQEKLDRGYRRVWGQ